MVTFAIFVRKIKELYNACESCKSHNNETREEIGTLRAEFEFRGGDFSNSNHGRQGFRAPLEARLDYVSFDSSKSRSRKGP